MIRFSKQIAGSIAQQNRVKFAYYNDLTSRLRYASVTAAGKLPLSLNAALAENDEERLAKLAKEVRMDGLFLLAETNGQLTIVGSSDQALVGRSQKAALPLYPSEDEAADLQPDGNFHIELAGDTNDKSASELWGFLRLPGRDYTVAVSIQIRDRLQLFDLTGPEAVIDDILRIHPELLELTAINPALFTSGYALAGDTDDSTFVLRDRAKPVMFGTYHPIDLKEDMADVARAAAGEIVFRNAMYNGQRVTVSYMGFNNPSPLVVRAILDNAYLVEEQTKQRYNQIIISGCLLIFVILGSYWLSGFLIAPVKTILRKVNEVAEGRFDPPIEVGSRDELGQLAARINAMSKNLDVYTNKLKNAFEENQRIKEHLESVINYTTDAIHIEETDGTIIQLNPAFEEMFGWRASEAIGRKLDLVPEHCQQEARKAYEALMNGQLLPPRETVRRRKDGKWIDVSITTSPIRDKKGVIRAFASITRDMTSRNKMDELLRRAEKLNTVGQLAAGVAHEIRNPLTTLRGFLQLQQQTRKLNLRHTDLMLSELDRINLIVSEFMILAKPQATKFEVKDVRFVLGDVMSLLDSQAHLCNIIFMTAFVSEPCEIACEENQLKQVFINVLKNAIEAMPKGGDIRIAVDRPNRDTIRIAITDEGEGIPEAMIPKLGEPFVTGKESGTGLGIMVSQRIIQSHHGTMEISSKVGEGTTVTITLPALPDE